MNLFDIAAALTLNTDDYDKGLSNAESGAKSFGSKLKGALGTAGKAAGAAITATAAGAAALTTSLIGGVKETAAYGDNIDKMSQKLGISAESLQEWDFILQHSGASIDALKPAMKTLTAAVESGSDAFAELGISQDQLASMSADELFSATISALQGVQDESKRTQLANKLLGKSGMELGALLNTSAEDTEAMRQQVHDLGGVMSDEAVKAAASFQDSVQNLTTASDGLKRNLLEEFMPSVTQVTDGLTALFSGDSETGLALISSGIDSVTQTITEKIPEFMAVVVQIIESVATAVVENLPTLLGSVLDALGQIVGYIIENLPIILDMVLQIVIEIATAIGEDLPELIPAIVDAVIKVAETLIEHLPDLLDAVLEIIKGLAQGILDALPVIIEALPEIIKGIVDFLLGAIPDIIQTGIDLLTSLVEALPDIIKTICEALPDIISGIIDALLENIPQIIQAGIDLLVALVDATPDIIIEIVKAIPEIITGIVNGFIDGMSKIVDVGKQLLEGIWEGIKNAKDWLKNKIKEWAKGLLDGIKSFFGIHSPSKVFKDVIGKNIALGLGDGISEYGEYAIDAMEQLGEDIMSAADIDKDIKASLGIDGNSDVSTAIRRIELTQNIYAQAMSPAEVFDEARINQERMLLLSV